MNISNGLNQLGEQILGIIEALKDGKQEWAERELQSLYENLVHKLLDFDSLIYLGIVKELIDSETQEQITSLNQIRDEILRKNGFVNTIAIRHPLIQHLNAGLLPVYRVIKQYINLLTQLNGVSSPEITEQCETLRSELENAIDPMELDGSLSALLLSLAVNDLMILPAKYEKAFNLDDVAISTVYTSDVTEQTQEYLQNVRHLIQKLEGELTLFLHIYRIEGSFLFVVK